MSVLVISIFVAWALLAALGQWPALGSRIGGRRALGLVPNFMFFTSRIVGHELELVIREVQDGSLAQWRVVPTARPRGALWFVWHPERRHAKAFLDLALQLTGLRLAGRRAEAPGDPAYARLREIAQPWAAPGARFQFAVRARDTLRSDAPAQLLFVSEECAP
jgi:hypothetical protein